MDEKETWWEYERLEEDGKIKTVYQGMNDYDGKLTGVPGVYGVSFWLDENPEKARALGWVKHIHHSIEKTVDAALQQAESMRQSILKKAFEGGL